MSTDELTLKTSDKSATSATTGVSDAVEQPAKLGDDHWDLVIRPKRGLLDVNLREVWEYWDLLVLFVRRDIVTVYKQTVLGPIWFFLQPILTTAVYVLVFGNKPAQVVWSTPQREDIEPRSVGNRPIRLIHHGRAKRPRRLEQMIDLMGLLDDRFELYLMLVGSDTYLAELQRRAGGHPRIHFLPLVATPDIVQATNRFDVGLAWFPPSTFNLRYCLPNKFFQYVQPRLAIAIGPTPDMAALVNQYALGVVASDFQIESLAEMLNGLSTEDIMRFKYNSHQAADELCWERESEKLLGIVEQALGSRTEGHLEHEVTKQTK